MIEVNIIRHSRKSLLNLQTLPLQPLMKVQIDEITATTNIMNKKTIESFVVIFIRSSLKAIVLINLPYSVYPDVLVTKSLA